MASPSIAWHYRGQYNTGPELPAIQDIYIRRCGRKAQKIARDSNHPSHRLFSLHPNSKQYQCKSDTNKLLSCFYPQAIRLITKQLHRVNLVSLFDLLFVFLHCLYAHSQGPTHSHTHSLHHHAHSHIICTSVVAGDLNNLRGWEKTQYRCRPHREYKVCFKNRQKRTILT